MTLTLSKFHGKLEKLLLKLLLLLYSFLFPEPTDDSCSNNRARMTV